MPAKGYYRQDGVDKIARFYKDDDDMVTSDYILVQSFYPGYIENKLYRTTSVDLLEFSNEVPLDAIPETQNLQETQQTGLEVPSLFVVKEDSREQNPTSIYQVIQNIVYAIDRNIVMFHNQFLQNVESFVIFKNVHFPTALLEDYNEGKKINLSKIGRYIMGSEDSSVEFANNQNDMLDRAIGYEDTQVRRLSGITAIPQDFL